MTRREIIAIMRQQMPERIRTKHLIRKQKYVLLMRSYEAWAIERCIRIAQQVPENDILDELQKFVTSLDEYRWEDTKTRQFDVAYETVTNLIGRLCAEQINYIFKEVEEDDYKRL